VCINAKCWRDISATWDVASIVSDSMYMHLKLMHESEAVYSTYELHIGLLMKYWTHSLIIRLVPMHTIGYFVLVIAAASTMPLHDLTALMRFGQRF